jgi:enamine deaminase RidA (YjgF/YER057c/UK114 family)
MIMESPGWRRSAASKIARISPWTQSAVSIPYSFTATPHSPSQYASRPDTILIVIGGQNGVEGSGNVVSDDIGDQARQALSNIQACLREAHADLEHIVRWSILIKDGAPLYDGFVAFMVTVPSGVCVR